MDWTALRLAPDATIRDALVVVDRAGAGIAFVCDGDDRLLGTVSDGDIRKALIAGHELTDIASTFMARTPKTADPCASKSEMLGRLEQFGLGVLPLVDETGRVVGAATIHELIETPSFDNPVFIMAGGFGSRLRPLTDTTPKPMLNVGGKPLLQRNIERFVAQGFTRIYISTHYLAEQIRDHFGDGSEFGAQIEYVHEVEPLGTGGALALLPDAALNLPLVMVNGDVITNVDYGTLLNHHVRAGVDATICTREYEYQVPFGVVQTAGGLVAEMVEKPRYRHSVNAGIYVVSPQVSRLVKRGTRIDMPTHLLAVKDRGMKVGLFNFYDYWLDIGCMDDFERAQADMRLAG
jgi:dTDP-glucose pyrophosphorylase